MTHKNEDELLAYALEVVADDEERAAIEAHLKICADCRARLAGVKTDIETISSVRPRISACGVLESASRPSSVWSLKRQAKHVQEPLEPRPRPVLLFTTLRAAALIAVGVLVGFGAGSRVHREPVFISPAYVEASPPAAPGQASAVSDATNVPEDYYKQITEASE